MINKIRINLKKYFCCCFIKKKNDESLLKFDEDIEIIKTISKYDYEEL